MRRQQLRSLSLRKFGWAEVWQAHGTQQHVLVEAPEDTANALRCFVAAAQGVEHLSLFRCCIGPSSLAGLLPALRGLSSGLHLPGFARNPA